jgi:hypothetical protein
VTALRAFSTDERAKKLMDECVAIGNEYTADLECWKKRRDGGKIATSIWNQEGFSWKSLSSEGWEIRQRDNAADLIPEETREEVGGRGKYWCESLKEN